MNDIVIFDTFSDVLLYDPTVESLAANRDDRRAVLSFFRRIMAPGTTTVLLVSSNGLPTEPMEPLRAVGDVLLAMTVDDAGSRQYRWINVCRFAGMGQQVADRIAFSIRPGTSIENRSVITQ